MDKIPPYWSSETFHFLSGTTISPGTVLVQGMNEFSRYLLYGERTCYRYGDGYYLMNGSRWKYINPFNDDSNPSLLDSNSSINGTLFSSPIQQIPTSTATINQNAPSSGIYITPTPSNMDDWPDAPDWDDPQEYTDGTGQFSALVYMSNGSFRTATINVRVYLYREQEAAEQNDRIVVISMT